ncbi:type III pantothenate kinase [Bacteroidales bacterium OttesenSCG-928-M11]|nr:type III pantothenate kinase [Bacteroidales bacterium OttesenSCG-928-M11]
MNIVIDQGNTSSKVALFENNILIETIRFKPLTAKDLIFLLDKYTPQNGILCSVGEIEKEVIDILKEKIPFFIELDEHTKLPIRSEYQTPHTLGKDRIAAVVGAYTRFPKRNLLIIDAGTAITYDFVNSDGVYKGGNISPGMTARFRSLHMFTKKLPMLDEEGDISELGYNTETAIRSGVVCGIIREMDSYVEEYIKKHNVLAFLTGGHSIYFADKLKNRIFADVNLVLKGLNDILIYQYA